MKYILPFLFLLFVFQLFGCSEDAVNQSNSEIQKAESFEQQPKTLQEETGVYFLHGYQVTKELCYAANCDNFVLSTDTLKTSFIVYIRMFEHRPDSLMFSGLEGADTNIREFNYTGSAAFGECTSETRAGDCAYAKVTGSNLEFDIQNPGGYYRGTGTLENGSMTLETEFIYRGVGIEYRLEGEKVENES